VILTDQAAYRGHPGVSFSQLKVFDSCAYLYFKRYVERSIPEDTGDTKAMRLGTAAHVLMLEGPGAYETRYAVKPETYPAAQGEHKEWNANATICKAWEAEQRAEGKSILTRDEAALLRRMFLGLHTNSEAVDLLRSGLSELGIIRPGVELSLKGRLDWFDPESGSLVDLKTIECLDDLPREIERRLYYRQLALYRHLASEEYGVAVRASIIGVEKTEPFRCGVYHLSEKLLELGDAENFASLTNLAQAKATGEWGGNPPTREIGPSMELQFRHSPMEFETEAP
jgi:hypothetical protein